MGSRIEQLVKERRSGRLIVPDRKTEQQKTIDRLDSSVKTKILQLAEEESWTQLDKYHRGTTEDWISMDEKDIVWSARFCVNPSVGRTHYGLLIVKLIGNFLDSRKNVFAHHEVLNKAMLRNAQFLVGISDDDRSHTIWKYSDSINEYSYPNLEDTLMNTVAEYYSVIDLSL
jgi:hypothetical protein